MNETITEATPAPAGAVCALGRWTLGGGTFRDVALRLTALQVGATIIGVAVSNLAMASYRAPEPVGTEAERAAYVAYSTCLRDMASERSRWEAAGGGAWTDPASCAQPVVGYGDYRRAYSVTWADYNTAAGR